jgi:hypothetical protein
VLQSVYLPQKVDKFLECARAAAFFSTKEQWHEKVLVIAN